jgi:ribosomal protein S18 acetylase RimI-like enzyme
MMEIDRFRHDDIDPFLHLAALEGWLCDRWELEFLLRSCPRGCFVVRGGDGPIAFITAISYGSSGWIGNLIVRSDQRGLGLGKKLMGDAIAALQRAGAETIWLTASRSGMPIYEKFGFTALDEVKRWAGYARGDAVSIAQAVGFEEMLKMDGAGWGAERAALLAAVLKRGTVLGSRDGFIVRQNCADAIQLGPWGCRSTEAAADLLAWAIAAVGEGRSFVLDVPVRNIAAASLLCARGFTIKGGTVLMYLGKLPAYRPDYVYALASMGSMG